MKIGYADDWEESENLIQIVKVWWEMTEKGWMWKLKGFEWERGKVWWRVGDRGFSHVVYTKPESNNIYNSLETIHV